MSKIEARISGLRFRSNDSLTTDNQLRIIGQRLSNNSAIRLRQGDDPSKLAEILAMRQPVKLEIVNTSAIVTIYDGGHAIPISEIEFVTLPNGTLLAKELVKNGFWECLMARDSSLKPQYWEDSRVGIKAGGKLPVVGITHKQADRAVDILRGITGEDWFIPSENLLRDGKEFIILGEATSLGEKIFDKDDFYEITGEEELASWGGQDIPVGKFYSPQTNDSFVTGSFDLSDKNIGVRFAKNRK